MLQCPYTLPSLSSLTLAVVVIVVVVAAGVPPGAPVVVLSSVAGGVAIAVGGGVLPSSNIPNTPMTLQWLAIPLAIYPFVFPSKLTKN
jgi:hypothetical protein